MKIAIHVADLDAARIDGTRVYMHNVLKYLGKLSPRDSFLLYHHEEFNPQLTPDNFANYQICSLSPMLLWTQTKFAGALWKDAPDVLWMPMANLPLLRRKSMKTVVTIHDLAFKYFPQHFSKSDLHKLNWLAKIAIEKSDRIIAVSQSTKKDILHFFPQISPDKISVIYHGFDRSLFQKEEGADFQQILDKHGIHDRKYILYVGAIQPRKNLEVLIDAFEQIKENFPDLQLVIAGEKAWMWKSVEQRIVESKFSQDIICTGAVPFESLPVLYKHALAFVFPSLYEGFGIPILEAFASGTPVIAAGNSSLLEIGADAAEFFDANDSGELAHVLQEVCGNSQKREFMITNGLRCVERFDWEQCAKETLERITKW